MTALEEIQKYYQQRTLAAMEWKAKGGKIIGYMCDKVPEELILAAGFFPLRISGDPRGDMAAADRYTEPFYEGFVRSMLNRILTGKYNFIDYLVIPHSRDTVVMLYNILQDVQELEPDVKLPEFYLYETLHTRLYLTDLYNRERLRDFKNKLEEWSGRAISDQALSSAIATVNDNRKLLKQVAGLRADEKPRISGTEALQVTASSMFMMKEEHNKILIDYLKGANNLPSRKGIRLFVAGSPHDNLQFYEIVESGGAIIVGEDSCWGNRYSDNPVSLSGDPLEAIADRYQNNSPCPWTFSIQERVNYCLMKAQEAKAQGAVFFLSEYDYTESFDYPNIKCALEEKGIPTLCFQNQKYFIAENERGLMKNSLEDFIRKIAAKIN